MSTPQTEPSPTSTLANPPASRHVVPLLFLALAATCAVVSHGFVEADEITHFLNSRSVWYDWTMILSIWGRMGCTGLYALVTPLGVVGARLLAVGITGAWFSSLAKVPALRPVATGADLA